MHLDSDEESDPEFQTGLPGGRAILSADTHLFRQVMWILLTSGCVFATLYQVQDRVSHYLKIPTRTEVRYDVNDSLPFPWITICTREPFNYTVMEMLRPLAAEKLGIDADQVTFPYDLISLMPIDKLWREIGNNIRVMEIDCWFGRGKYCNDTGTWYEVMTVLGPCSQFRAREPVKETGLFNGLYIQMDGNKLTRPIWSKNQVPDLNEISFDSNSYSDGWTFMIHSDQYEPVYGIGQKGNNMMPESSLDVKIIFSETTVINLERSPCNARADYNSHECLVNCLKDEFLHLNACLLPFMIINKNAPQNLIDSMCSTPSGYRNADHILTELLSSSTWVVDSNTPKQNGNKCNCSRSCRSSYYTINQETVLADVKPKRLRFRVFFQDKSIEQRIEREEYSLIGLFCDIGNSIGLLLGASVLALAEAIEFCGLSLVRYCKRSSRRGRTERRQMRQRRIHPGNPLER